MIRFYGEGLLAPHPTPKLKDHPLLAVCDCLFSIFTVTLCVRVHPFICNLRMHYAMVRGTDLSREIPTIWCNMSVLDTMLCLPVIVLFVLCFVALTSSDQMLQSSARHLCFLFRVPGLKTSVQKPAVMTGPFWVFLSSLRHPGIFPQIGHNHFLLHPNSLFRTYCTSHQEK